MESNEIRNEPLEAERATVAPFIHRPLYPWWHAALLGLAGPLFALVVSQTLRAIQGRVVLGLVPILAISLIMLVVVQDQRKRRGSTP